MKSSFNRQFPMLITPENKPMKMMERSMLLNIREFENQKEF